MPKLIDNPEHWRTRAAEVRRAANDALNDKSRMNLMSLAEDYERLAKLAERRIKANPEKDQPDKPARSD
jgi:hypothetical protein